MTFVAGKSLDDGGGSVDCTARKDNSTKEEEGDEEREALDNLGEVSFVSSLKVLYMYRYIHV